MIIDIPTAVTDVEADRLRFLAEDREVLEIGSLLGYSTVLMARVARVVHSVDPHEGYPINDPRPTLQPFIENLERYKVRPKVVAHLGRDAAILPLLQPAIFDFAFIDITGMYADTWNCLVRAWRVVRPGGQIAVHDCGRNDWPGAGKAVADFSHQFYVNHRRVDTLEILEVRDR